MKSEEGLSFGRLGDTHLQSEVDKFVVFKMETRELQISHQKDMPQLMDLKIPFHCNVPGDPIPGKTREGRKSDGLSEQDSIALP